MRENALSAVKVTDLDDDEAETPRGGKRSAGRFSKSEPSRFEVAVGGFSVNVATAKFLSI